jgi:hypothetical protein
MAAAKKISSDAPKSPTDKSVALEEPRNRSLSTGIAKSAITLLAMLMIGGALILAVFVA